MEITTVFLILALLYALYKAYNFGTTKEKHSGRIASSTPFTTPQTVFHNNPYTGEFKMVNSDILVCKEQLTKVQNHTKQIIDDANQEELLEYHKILRKTTPLFKGKPLFVFTGEYEVDLSFDLLYSKDYQVIIDNLFSRKNLVSDSTTNLADKGKILGFTIGLSTIDGAPIAESKGFVDYYDIPPIDTWFFLTGETLLCWIPNEYVDIMQGAIDVEIFDAYFWLEDIDNKLNNQLLENKKTHNTV